jgi:hypothetical protein
MQSSISAICGRGVIGITIGIGVLGSEGKHSPERIILASDSLGSFGDAYSTGIVPKDML